jgi:hypothetical protein
MLAEQADRQDGITALALMGHGKEPEGRPYREHLDMWITVPEEV